MKLYEFSTFHAPPRVFAACALSYYTARKSDYKDLVVTRLKTFSLYLQIIVENKNRERTQDFLGSF